MIIQLKGVGETNKGAYLMFLSIIEHFKEFHSDKDLTFVTHLGHKFSKDLARRYKIKPLVKTRRKGLEFRSLIKPIPFFIRKRMGLYIDSDLDVILDASGFLYGDQWPVRSIKGTLSNDIKKLRSNGTKVILMPQAFGSFNNRDVEKEVGIIVDNANLIFARDQVSLQFLTDSFGKRDNIFLAPDFTNILSASGSNFTDYKTNRILLIPNIKLLEETDISKENLINLFKEIIDEIKLKGYSVAFLIHEGIKDETLAIPVIIEPDAIKQKRIIGNSYAVITGRFHGLVSALSQGVPSIGLSWSHKYEMLLENYGQNEFLLELNSENVKSIIEKILDKENNKRLSVEISEKASLEKEKTYQMWSKVDKLIFEND
jgi:polysaccharide pyruvyl transferase WcaK-like protein